MTSRIGRQDSDAFLLGDNGERSRSDKCRKLIRYSALTIATLTAMTSIITRGYFCEGGLNGEDENCYEKNPHLAPVEWTFLSVVVPGTIIETIGFVRDRCLQ